jgi:hypothetical protein
MLDLDSCVVLKPEQDLVLMNLLSKSYSQVAWWGGQFQGWGSNSTNSMEEETFWWKGGIDCWLSYKLSRKQIFYVDYM